MVYLDTNVIVYLLEGVPGYALPVARILNSYKENGLGFCISTLVISEFIAGTTGSISNLHSISGLVFKEVDESIATKSGLLQRDYALKIGDSIHLATAIETECETFFTNDKKLANIAHKYLEVKLLSDHTKAR